LLTVKATMNDLASVTENALVGAFNSAEDALVQFVKTGEVNMKEFALNIIADITRVIARLLILQSIQGIGGALGGGGGQQFIGTGSSIGNVGHFAHGGQVSPNKPIIVGEEGPEIFNPSTSGAIIPNDTTTAALGTSRSQQAPVVNVTAPPAMVQVINVSDPDEVPSAMQSPEGEQAILNVIQRNPQVIRRGF